MCRGRDRCELELTAPHFKDLLPLPLTHQAHKLQSNITNILLISVHSFLPLLPPPVPTCPTTRTSDISPTSTPSAIGFCFSTIATMSEYSISCTKTVYCLLAVFPIPDTNNCRVILLTPHSVTTSLSDALVLISDREVRCSRS